MDENWRADESIASRKTEKYHYIVSQTQIREGLYNNEELEREATVMRTFQNQFEQANLRNIYYACVQKPIGLFAKLMPTV